MQIVRKTISIICFLVKYILCFQNQRFNLRIGVSFLELELLFWNWNFVFKLLFQFKFEASFPVLKLCFRNLSFGFLIKTCFSESQLHFQLEKTIYIGSFVFNVFLRLKFDASFLESKHRLSKRIFNSGNQSVILETKFRFQKRIFNSRNKTQIWIVITSYRRISDPWKEASVLETILGIFN